MYTNDAIRYVHYLLKFWIYIYSFRFHFGAVLQLYSISSILVSMYSSCICTLQMLYSLYTLFSLYKTCSLSTSPSCSPVFNTICRISTCEPPGIDSVFAPGNEHVSNQSISVTLHRDTSRIRYAQLILEVYYARIFARWTCSTCKRCF
jgi:hypothetical protein